MQPGMSVRILILAGAVKRGTAASATRFVGEVQPGQLGLYQGPMPESFGEKDWHVIALGSWDVCLHSSQFEPTELPTGGY